MVDISVVRSVTNMCVVDDCIFLYRIQIQIPDSWQVLSTTTIYGIYHDEINRYYYCLFFHLNSWSSPSRFMCKSANEEIDHKKTFVSLLCLLMSGLRDTATVRRLRTRRTHRKIIGIKSDTDRYKNFRCISSVSSCQSRFTEITIRECNILTCVNLLL